MIQLYQHQLDALDKLKVGSVLYGDVGTGKTFTSLAFYKANFSNLSLVVITTAKKRNDGDWEEEAELSGIPRIQVDSWNNLENYKGLQNTFYIFDE